MESFKSKHFPKSSNLIWVLQEYAIRYYSILFAVVMCFVLFRMSAGKAILMQGLIGSAGSILIGNLMAWIRINRLIGQIFFISDSFSILTVYDILGKEPQKSFPKLYANANRQKDHIQLHFRDRVIQLKREDWDEFDLIGTWLTQS